ncbi:hypothetical protein NQ318_012860 [Aromia moschata]|uniref:EF-hand domain-containing protein n=1 Tax=Aromia moschata TaxID=1265417 RepID=A0AAV8YD42_9CUCU|nr:hypothetical protein NQ318_012860 [Aromia moschata]
MSLTSSVIRSDKYWKGVGKSYNIVGPLTGARYLRFLQNEIEDILDELPLNLWHGMYFQQDGAPPHNSRIVIDYLQRRFGEKRFREVRPDLVPKQMKQNQEVHIRIPIDDTIEKLPELRVNPFKKRICEVFSRDGKGNLSFEDFLDLLSVFSEQAPRDIKVFYAFRIYDFDGDQHIGPEDLDQAVLLLTGQTHELTPEDRQQIVEKVIEEADVDGDGKLSYMEFEHVITRAPDFLSTFHILPMTISVLNSNDPRYFFMKLADARLLKLNLKWITTIIFSTGVSPTKLASSGED